MMLFVCLRLRLKAKLVARAVSVRMRLRGKVIRSQREQVVAAYYSPPPPSVPCRGIPFAVAEVKGQTGEKTPPSGPQTFQHSSAV